MARMTLFVKVCCVLCLYSTKAAAILDTLDAAPDDPDIHTNISGLIKNKGYPVEEHSVQTSDGYILSLIRIPHGRNSTSETGNKGVVLIIHGIVLDASTWVINLPNQSLGFVLPDAGYDVWLLNCRGTTYSRKHVKYTTDKIQFWNFSYDEMARYNVPESIDYILETTGEEQLYVIGYSQGSAATFAMLSEMPDYNDKVKLFVVMAPVAWTAHLSAVAIRLLIIIKDEIALGAEIVTSGEFLSNRMFKSFRVKFCSTYGTEFCEAIVALGVGFDRKQVNQTRMGVYSAHMPGGTSAKSLVHFGQTTQSKQFRKYDYYLPSRNLEHYNQSGLITNKGYPLEEHWVQTADGYILSLLRIPHGINNSLATGKKDVVLFIPGIVVDASMWVLNLPNQSLGFVLPDAGYDAWFISIRGTTYSKRHVTYPTNECRYWNFSSDEVARYDLPATIDYVLKATGEEKLYILGASQGTTTTFAMLPEMPDYNDKVKLFVAMAPVAWISHLKSPLLLPLVPIKDVIDVAVTLVTSGEFLSNDMFKSLRVKLCSASYTREICEATFFLTGGKDKTQTNETRLGVYSAHTPAGTSVKSLVHYAQMVKSNKFRKYDYQRHLNLKYYHQEEPPDYDVSRITAPVALFWSENDPLADPEDVATLRRNLNTIVFDYLVPYPYNHFDFFIAMNAPLLVNKPLLELLSNYSNAEGTN